MRHRLLTLLLPLAAGCAQPISPRSAPLAAQQAGTPVPAAVPLTAEEWRADLGTMIEELRRRHRNLYHTTDAATLDSAAAALDARIPRLARHEIIAEMMKIVAMVGDGHTNIYPTRDSLIGFQTLPISLYLFKDGWYFRAADSAHRDIVGARVIRIGDVPIEDAYARVKSYIGRDNEMGAKFWAAYLLAMPEMLHALQLSPSIDSARFELESNGHSRTTWLRPAGPVPMTPADTDISWWMPSAAVDARMSAAGAEPLWLSRRPDSTMFWFQMVPDTRIGYAQINEVNNSATESFEDFSYRLLQFADTAGLEKLVIDLRLNRGGNGSLLRPLVKGLLRRPGINAHGNLFVVIGRGTWSAAQFLVNDLLEFSEATFVGEPTGSKGNHYGDSRRFTLPNSGISVRASSLYWQDWNPLDPRQWVAPGIAAELTFADYSRNRDPALEAVRSFVPAPHIAERLRHLVGRGDTAEARERFDAFVADAAHAYVDAHTLLDQVALTFYHRKDIERASWVFALAAGQYPGVLRSHLNLAAVYQQLGRTELEKASLRRALELSPAHRGAAARLQALEGPP